jgi:hypothetical protein
MSLIPRAGAVDSSTSSRSDYAVPTERARARGALAASSVGTRYTLSVGTSGGGGGLSVNRCFVPRVRRAKKFLTKPHKALNHTERVVLFFSLHPRKITQRQIRMPLRQASDSIPAST